MRDLQTSKQARVTILNFLNSSWNTSKRPCRRGQVLPLVSQKKLRKDSGQIVLEYILLLVISVGVATYMTKRLVGRDPEDPGSITSTWNLINTTIGADIID